MKMSFEVQWRERADGTFWWWVTMTRSDVTPVTSWTSQPAQLFFKTREEAQADIVLQVNKLVRSLGLAPGEVVF